MKSRKKRKLKAKWIVWPGLILLGFILYSNIRIDQYAKGRLYDTASTVPHYHTALVGQGVPEEVIFLDPAGFRTLDSVVRAKEVFGQSGFIVVSQKFHNERAVFIAGKKGIKAVGFNAADVPGRYGLITYVREWGARCKVFLDLLSGKKPRLLGEPVDIG